MSPNRISGALAPRTVGSACALILVLTGSVACETYTTLRDVPIECDADSAYDFEIVDTKETVGAADWWTSGSPSSAYEAAKAIASADVRKIEGDGRCGSAAATVLRSYHNNDWGSIFGLNYIPAVDRSGYEGVAYWSRAPGNTTKTFTMALEDPNTAKVAGGNCIQYTPDDQTGTQTPTTATGPNGESISTSGSATRAVYPDECGNSYAYVNEVTSHWAFYTVPFGLFQQDAKPNRVPNAILTDVGTAPGTALLTSRLVRLIVRMPKEADTELWVDNLAFYKRKAP
jgi:hypothetical protein